MRLARYWVKEKHPVRWGRHDVRQGCWGWSETSEEEARQMSAARSSRLAAWLQALGDGRPEELGLEYDYDSRPLREEILQEFENEQRETTAAVTRNRYGALVLNTSELVFLDHDIRSPLPRLADLLPKWLRRLFGVKDRPPAPDPAEAALDSVRAWCDARPQYAVRVYRTTAGYRLAITNRAIRADSSEAGDLLQDGDRLYALLCEKQACYRARLTPKPWRIRLPKPPSLWPHPDAEAEAAFDAWLKRYDNARADRSVCRLIETHGPDETLEELRPLLDLHDRIAGVGTEGELA